MNEVLSLLRGHIDEFGHLSLNKEQTSALILWVEKTVNLLNDSDDATNELLKLIERNRKFFYKSGEEIA